MYQSSDLPPLSIEIQTDLPMALIYVFREMPEDIRRRRFRSEPFFLK